MNKSSKKYTPNQKGMVDSAIVYNIMSKGYTNIIGKSIVELDLCIQDAVKMFFEEEKSECIFLSAAKVEVLILSILMVQNLFTIT